MSFIGKSTSGVLDIKTQGKEIIEGVKGESVALRAFTKLPNMTSGQHTIPVATQLAQASFVSGDAGLKSTSIPIWEGKNITAEEVAVVVPISENMLKDSSYDIFGQIAPQVKEAFGRAIDSAILFGKGKPDSWQDGIVEEAIEKEKVVVATGDLYEDIMGEDGLISKVEESGYFVDGFYSPISMRGKLRGLRDDNKNPIFVTDMKMETSPYALDGSPLYFNQNGVVMTDDAKLVAGDFKQAVYSIREDIDWKLFTEGVVSDNNGKVLYNLMQNDMVALRFTMRLGWALPNPVNAVDSSESRYPFAVLTSEESGSF